MGRRFINKNTYKRKKYLFLLFVCFFLLGVGYAVLSSNLEIGGTIFLSKYYADYTVNHYVHDLGSNTYTLVSTEHKKGRKNSEILFDHLKKNIAGATYLEGYLVGDEIKPTMGEVTSTTILEDGSRVIHLYYRRNYLYLKYHVNGGVLSSNNTNLIVTDDLVYDNTTNQYIRGVYGSKVGGVNLSTYEVDEWGLHNTDNPDYIKVLKTGYHEKINEEWNTKSDGSGISYDHYVSTYDADGFAGADLSTGDKVVTLYVNWIPNTYTITLNHQNATSSGTTSVTSTYDELLPTITIPSKTGYYFTGYYTSLPINLKTNSTRYTNSYRINFSNAVDASNDWFMTTEDKGTHLDAKIIVEDANLSTEPGVEFNDIAISKKSVSKVGNQWILYLDFDITEHMVTKKNWNYDTEFRFFDITGINNNTIVKAEYIVKNGEKYIDDNGVGVKTSNFLENSTLYANWVSKHYTITLNQQNATTSGTTSVEGVYDSFLPNITIPVKTGSTFKGFYSNTSAIDLSYSFERLYSNTVLRVNFPNSVSSSNGWAMTNTDKGVHLQAKILLEDSSTTTTNPVLEFNDVVISPRRMDKNGNRWVYYIDFDITEYMVTSRSYQYETVYRFFDFERVSQNATATVEYLVKGGKKYYDSLGVGVYPSDFLEDGILYAKWG